MGIDIDSDINNKLLTFMYFAIHFNLIEIIGYFHKDWYVTHNNYHWECFSNQVDNDHYTPEIQILINIKLTFWYCNYWGGIWKCIYWSFYC
jgi:hypothetical protein